MRIRFHGARAALVALACSAVSVAASAQTPKPPKAQLWIDLSTGGMAGMPDVDMPAGAGGMLGGLMGGRGGPAGGGGNTSYGMARGMNVMPPRVMDVALYNSLRPGIEAELAIPPGLRMGERLPLVPPQAQREPEREPGAVPREYREPKGRILIYWGCGAEVRPGQPRIIDLAKGAGPEAFGAAFAGRFAADRGAKVSPSHALYPNEKNRVSVARDSSLVGEHQVLGPGVPASMKFTLGVQQDLMPAIDVQASGSLADSIAVGWRSVERARAYYLHAMGQAGQNDMVMWSSAETGDTGMGLFDYLPNATIDRWLREKVLLQPDVTQCAIPKGIFASAESGGRGNSGAMLRMVAYGSESNFAYPPRPADPKAVWEPEWAVRVRVKSTSMAALGEETGRRRAAPARGAQSPAGTESSSGEPAAEPKPSLPTPANLLKGLFGR